jgi:hypothetical protein
MMIWRIPKASSPLVLSLKSVSASVMVWPFV